MSVADAVSPVAPSPTLWRRGVALQARFPLVQLLCVFAAYGIGAATLPGLATWSSGRIILVLASLAGIAAIGQTLLILMGGFDLSIAGIVVASALIVTQVRDQWGVSFAVALLVALLFAGALGALAGQVCHRFNIQPLIVTLATGTIAVGLAQTQTPTGVTFGAGAPRWLVNLSGPSGETFGIGVPPLFVIWVLAAIAMTILLHRTVAGRHMLATGANQRAANYTLINTRRVWTVTFAFSACVSVFLGLAVAGFGGSITTSSGAPYMFQSVIVVILGGTIFGGPGDYARTVVGALFYTVVSVVLVGHGATEADQQIIFGLALLAIVFLYGRERRIRDRV